MVLTWRSCLLHGSRVRIFAFYFGMLMVPVALAGNLDVTDEYLKGLSEEVNSPEYVSKARQELQVSESHEKTHNEPVPEVQSALKDVDKFETLLKTQYPASFHIYSTFSTGTRVAVFNDFQKTQKLSSAKRMIIDQYLSKIN